MILHWICGLIWVRSMLCCSGGGGDDSTETEDMDDKPPGKSPDKPTADEDMEDPDLNAYGNDHPGMTLIMLKNGTLNAMPTNTKAMEYDCHGPEIQPIVWSKHGPIGGGVFHQRSLIMCGVSTDQKSRTSSAGCAELTKDRKWKPLKAELPKELSHKGVALAFTHTKAGIWGMIYRGKATVKTFTLTSKTDSKWVNGPDLPMEMKDFCVTMLGTAQFTGLVGGYAGKALKDFRIYTWKAKRWFKSTSMKNPRFNAACGIRLVKRHSHLVVAGGMSSPDKALVTAAQFDISRKEWTSLQSFDTGWGQQAGIAKAVFTIYFGEPLLIGGELHLKEGKKTNVDYFHLQGDGKSSYWSRLDREAFPSMAGVNAENTIRFDASPRNVPTCKLSKDADGDSGKSRRAWPICNYYCGSCCRYAPCRPCNELPNWPNVPCTYYPSVSPCTAWCGYGGCGAVPVPVPAQPYYPPPQPYYSYYQPYPYYPNPYYPNYQSPPYPNPYYALVEIFITVRDSGTSRTLTSVSVYVAQSQNGPSKTTNGAGQVMFRIYRGTNFNVRLTRSGFNSNTYNWHVSSYGTPQYFTGYMSQHSGYCSTHGGCYGTFRRGGGNKKAAVTIQLTWGPGFKSAQDLDLHIIEYKDRQFKQQTCKVNYPRSNSTNTCEQSKNVIMAHADDAYGASPEVMVLPERAHYFYVVEVYDHTPKINLDHKKSAGDYRLRGSNAAVSFFDETSNDPVFTYKENAAQNFYEVNEDKMSHWFVGCFDGSRPLSMENFHPVNKMYTIPAEKDDFLSQSEHSKKCAYKLRL